MSYNKWAQIIFNAFILLYGLTGLLGVINIKAVLSTFMILFFGISFGFLDFIIKNEKDKD